MARDDIPKITWEAAFANTLEFGWPPDNARSYDVPREGSSWSKSPAGERDSWLVGVDNRLLLDVRSIPAVAGTTTAGIPITGWDGAAGWRAFFAWAWAGNLFRFFPLRTSGTFKTAYLIVPREGLEPPGLESREGGTYRFAFEIESADGTRFEGY